MSHVREPGPEQAGVLGERDQEGHQGARQQDQSTVLKRTGQTGISLTLLTKKVLKLLHGFGHNKNQIYCN